MRRFLLIATFAAAMIAPDGSASAAPPCTITGTGGNDNLVGTKGDDVICGLGGNDVLSGAAGNDYLDGGADRDTFLAGKGNDTIDGGTGIDIAGFYDVETTGVIANLGTLSAMGSQSGADTFVGSVGDASIEDLYGSPGNDVLTGDVRANYLYGRQGNDSIDGSDGNDVIVGGDGDDGALYGGIGDDAIQPGDGADTMNGGVETAVGDTLKYNDATGSVFADLATGLTGGAATGDTIVNFENVTGSAFDDVLRAALGPPVSVVNGILGNDLITVDDGSGGDTANGGGGADICGTDIGDTEVSCP
jgi:hemolysin type calcium-binding protein